MLTLTHHLGLGLVLLLSTLAVRSATVNRLVKRKLRLPAYAAAVAILLAAALASGRLPADLADRLRSVETLLLALAAVALLVVVAANPLRADRVPAAFPNILQDAIIAAGFMVVATAVLQEKFLTTSAVGAVVVGFALQDTLGNAFAGLAIQTEKPFRTGQWIRVGEHEGCVEELTWRATKLRTKANTFVIVPNSVMSKEAIVNYSEPVVPTRLSLEIGASYLVPPNDVKAAIREAVADAPLALEDPSPDVLLVDFGNSAIVYRVRFWVEDYGRDDLARDQVRTNIYYAFRRRGIEIPYPIQVEYQRAEEPARGSDTTARFAELVAHVEIFGGLDESERTALAETSIERLYAEGETVVRQGEIGGSMFVVASGRVRVTIAPERREVATIERGGYFGEMSLLTGEARTATVSAVTDCLLMEVTAGAFRRFVIDKPTVLERVSQAVVSRREELDRTRAAGSGGAPPDQARSFLARVRRFLRLPT